MINAYALFFLAVLIGSALILLAMLRHHAQEVAAVLRGGQLAVPDAPARSPLVRLRSGRRPALPPIRFSICRL
jgi:hypothetical protein